jgi:PAS domain S-box-containing protein
VIEETARAGSGIELSNERGLVASSEELLRALTAATPVGVFVTDTAGDCVYANERLAVLTGVTEEQLLGSGWTAALHPDDVERVTDRWFEETGADFALAFRFLRADGGVTWVEASASALRDDDGVVAGWVGMCVDQTARNVGRMVIADELHNGPVQHLAAFGYRLDLVDRRLGAGDIPEGIELLRGVRTSLTRSLETLRRLMSELHAE